jgi:predicted acyltransferase
MLMTKLVENPDVETPARQRLMSVDALRGFDMFWIIGADSLVYALHRMSQTRATSLLADQLDHAEWAGFHFYDLIFPLFVFLVGVSLVFSLTKAVEQAGRTEALKRVFRRSVLLFALGIFYSGGLTNPWPDIRLMGVLNRIALAYFFAGLLFCCFKPRALVAICVSILVGYWALMSFVPIRDIQLTKSNLEQLAARSGDGKTAALFRDKREPSAVKDSPAWAAAERMFYATAHRVTGKFDEGLNLANHVDFRYLPARKYDTFFDPEGYLSTIPAVATCLLGVFAGLLLRSPALPDQRKVVWLVVFGIAAAGLGWLWNFQFPVIKKIWTSSFVLVAGGYSAILLGLFYLIVDVWRVRAWCQPFVWMGMNSITIYLTNNILHGFRPLATRFVGGDVNAFLENHVAKGLGELVISIAGLLLAFWLVHFLYQRKIFLRV